MNETLLEHLKHSKCEELFPPNTMDDGSQCPDTEEHHMGLCYITCATLPKGKYPIGSTAFSCCKEKPCGFFTSIYSNPLSYCSDYDVVGNFASVGRSKVCPHKQIASSTRSSTWESVTRDAPS